MKHAKRFAYVVTLPALLVLVWWAATLGSTNVFVPRPGPLVGTFAEVWVGERFVSQVVPSMYRLVGGLAASIVLGIGLGLLVGSVRWLRETLEPVLEFFRAIPPPVLVPVLMLLVGVGNQMNILVIVLGCLWPVLLNTIEGVRAVDPVLSETSRSYGITGLARLRYLVIPSASPQMMAGVRQSLSLGLILMVISEMFASSAGLGFTIVQFQRSFAVSEMWSGIVLLGLIGVGMASVFQLVERRTLSWYHGLKEAENA